MVFGLKRENLKRVLIYIGSSRCCLYALPLGHPSLALGGNSSEESQKMNARYKLSGTTRTFLGSRFEIFLSLWTPKGSNPSHGERI